MAAEQVEADVHKQNQSPGGGRLSAAGVAGVRACVRASGPHRHTTIYGELIRKWQRESEVGFCTDTSGIGTRSTPPQRSNSHS